MSTPATRASARLMGRASTGRRNASTTFGLAIAAILLIVVPVRAFVFEPMLVASTSMRPSLADGDLIFVDKISPRLAPVRAGSIVAAQPAATGSVVVKRVVATGGQTVEIYEGALLVDGRMTSEPYADSRQMGGIFFGPQLVPEGSVFLLGDNRIASVDSRDFGAVPVDDIRGTVVGSWATGGRGREVFTRSPF